eukprot:c38848_g1_i1.p1 GENE.c38848_g1_i1~~c38848_g1_i1.p1  ORF type:complete len:460 (+),score=111.03 c38848_g1_i1:43-1422(+)
MAVTLESCARECVNFINRSPSPFHAVDSCVQRLLGCGFQQLSERETWALKPSQRYFFTRNQSTIVAFSVGAKYKPGNPMKIVAAHTDSPHLKVKPVSLKSSSGFLQVGVELYGGGLWHTWFDRDLALAGRVLVQTAEGITARLVNIDRPILRIPNLAIHLTAAKDRESFAFNAEDNTVPVLATFVKGQLEGAGPKAHHPLLIKLLSDELACAPEEITDFELSMYDHHKATIGGACNEFVFGARLDNLCSSFCALESIVESSTDAGLKDEEGVHVVCLFDNEEVGSNTSQGAGSSILQRFLTRSIHSLSGGKATTEIEEQTFRNSFIVSADMAHGVHPNYSAKHESNHRPAIHGGVVIKYNSNQRYATNAVSASVIRQVAKLGEVPLQEFVVRNDCPCGSTVGPILSTLTGIRAVDIGLPQLSMHSIREMCGVEDLFHYVRIFNAFFAHYQAVDASLEVD